MAIVSNLILISLSIVCVFSFNYKRLGNDHMCTVKGAILCVKDELKIIATIAKDIKYKLNELEKKIEEKTLGTRNKNINADMNYARSHIPTIYYHKKFFNRSNIDKEFLSKLLLEAHNAMLYYYNSIDDLLKLENLFAQKTDELFKKIQDNIRKEIICRYRNVLYAYSIKWKSVHDNGRIQFSNKQRLCPSCTHNVHSIVIARYLGKLMELISNVLNNLETKLA